MPPSGKCRALNPSKACACPAANATRAIARVSGAHAIVELLDCLPSVACMGACVKFADVSGIFVVVVSG
eukprot:2818467-Pleurochrysis_carterae.AAC.1